MTSPVGVQPAAATLLTGIAADIHQVADCSWTVAMLYTEHHELHCVCGLGDPVDLSVCRESSLAVMASADPGEVALYRFGHPVAGVPTMVCPVRMDGVTVAVVAIGPKKRTSRYSESDRAFVTHCAKNVGHLLENERMASAVATHVVDMQRTKLELQTARYLQNRLLPNCLTQIPGFDYYGECRPAEDVGGDFFDVVGVDHGARFAVGDITGKGVPAAIMMAGIQATLRGLMGVNGATPLDVMQALNRRVWEISPDNLFATMFYAELDAADSTLRYVNAGHPPAFLIRARTSTVERLDVGGTVLGLSRHSWYQQRTVRVSPGDILMASTDGLSEAVDLEGHELEEEGLLRIVRQSVSESARDTVGSIMRAVDDYTGRVIPADDQTALIVRLATQREHGRRDRVFAAMAAGAA